MPINDQCATEENAFQTNFAEGEQVCAQALDALLAWAEDVAEVWDECISALEPPPDIPGPGDTGVPVDVDPILIHELERQWEAYREEVMNCVSGDSAVFADWSLYQDLQVECDVAREEWLAFLDEYENCLHDLNKGIPFA
jgi:hypothetical protein